MPHNNQNGSGSARGSSAAPEPASLASQAGALIRAGRRARGWSQTELAERAGMNYRTISNIERGANTSLETLEMLMGLVGIRLRLESDSADALLRAHLADQILKEMTDLLPRLSYDRLQQLSADMLHLKASLEE